ncbi:MAU2 chromatid cohesion factor-like protein [Dinothrombium tinctorium]|uniref:MAU2 chromatid cohesion factor homolog n=1 Tax=Dinothrombium tinctorium TaxID=1965070 RepID=A0A3S3QZT7_9ACAR|nr:MAU2 chromatid cohesion factor-like protein [Dinothrombium tinctorium]
MSVAIADNSCVALLSLAEGFRTSSPPDIQSCLQCLLSILNIPTHPRIAAKTHLQLGNMLLQYTTNLDIAQSHIEKAWALSQTIAGSDDIKLEAASLLAGIYEKQNQSQASKQILRKGLEESAHSVYWHCKLLFQLAQIHAHERDYALASNVLSAGADFAHMSGAHYTRILFLLSKGMMLMIDRRLTEVHPVLSLAGQLVETWQGNVHQKESLKVFFLVLQVCHHLNAGQVKSVKAPLKLLQQSIQNITTYHADEDLISNNSVDNFHWMAKEHMCVLVYLVTVLHSMQAGYMDKAQKYTEKALMQIEKLKLLDDHPLLHTFQLLLLEHIAMCRLVMGSGTLAIKETVQAFHICVREARLKVRHKPLVHALLGLYAMSINCLDVAENQLGAVLRTQTATSELRILASLNLSIVYLRLNREKELSELLAKLNPEALPSVSQSLKAASYYVLGLNAFFQARYNDAKRFLRETLKMANAEDLNRLTSCSLVLLGHIFYSLGNTRESMNMVTPAMQLASKIPDIHVQLWATALLKDLYRLLGDPVREQEAIQMHHQFSQHLLNDHYQATQLQEHNYIHVSIFLIHFSLLTKLFF